MRFISAGPQDAPCPQSPSWSAPPRRREPMADKNWKTIEPFQMLRVMGAKAVAV
jgi:hypothetical protein